MATAAMDKMSARYANRDVRSIFLYTREAHPGEIYGYHTSMDDKRSNAQAFVDQYQVKRPILLDTLEGDAHRTYGILPNMTWIISRGIIHYKAAWTDVNDIEQAISDILSGLEAKTKGERLPFYSERLCYRVRDDDAFRKGLERSGPQAVSDFYGKS